MLLAQDEQITQQERKRGGVASYAYHLWYPSSNSPEADPGAKNSYAPPLWGARAPDCCCTFFYPAMHFA